MVITARDLVRQITAEWQEHVKHRSSTSFEEFVHDLRADTDRDSWFWQVQYFPRSSSAGGRSAARAGARRDRAALGHRVLGAVGPVRDVARPDPVRVRPRPRAVQLLARRQQAELLRRVNVELGDRLPLPGPYPAVVKNVLAHRVLAERPGPGCARRRRRRLRRRGVARHRGPAGGPRLRRRRRPDRAGARRRAGALRPPRRRTPRARRRTCSRRASEPWPTSS